MNIVTLFGAFKRNGGCSRLLVVCAPGETAVAAEAIEQYLAVRLA